MKKIVKAEGKRSSRIIRKIEQKMTFRKIFLTITLAMLLVAVLCFCIMYSVVKKIIMEENIEASANQFIQIQQEFELVNEQINMVATQVILDDVCSDWLLTGDGSQINSLDIARMRKQLLVFQNTSSMIESIYIYNGKIDRFLSTDASFHYTGKGTFEDIGIVKILSDYENYRSRNLFKRELVLANAQGQQESHSVYTYVLNNTQDSHVTSAIVVNLDLAPLFAKVMGMEAMQDSQMAIVDEKDEVWAELQNLSGLDTNVLESPIVEEVKGDEGYAETTYKGERYFVSWMHSDKSDWDYVKISKWNTLFERLLELRRWGIIICAVLVLAVAGGSVFTSVSIYRLYGKLEKKNFIKNRMKESEVIKLKEDFLNEFIHKRKLFGKQELYERIEQLGYVNPEGQLYTILVLQVEEYHSLIEEFGQDGVYDIKFGVRNIFEEIFNNGFRVQGLINRDDSIVFIMRKSLESVSEKGIEEKFKEFCEKIQPFGDWKFSLIGSQEFVRIEDVPELAEKIYQIKAESFFYPSNTFLTYERISKQHQGNVNYRKLDIGKLTDTLRGGKDISEQYQTFTESLEGYCSKDYMNAMIWFGVSLVRNMKEFYSTDAKQEYTLNHFLTELAKCEKKVQADKLFGRIFDCIIQIQESANVKKGVTGKVEEIQIYIQENYTNLNIALEFLGDEFGVSANYLGRIFKKEAGMSVSEYLNNVRLQKVLEGLEKTDKPAKDIAEACGFASINYFYTYFRKKMGVTPQVYRQQLQNKEK